MLRYYFKFSVHFVFFFFFCRRELCSLCSATHGSSSSAYNWSCLGSSPCCSRLPLARIALGFCPQPLSLLSRVLFWVAGLLCCGSSSFGFCLCGGSGPGLGPGPEFVLSSHGLWSWLPANNQPCELVLSALRRSELSFCASHSHSDTAHLETRRHGSERRRAIDSGAA